MKNLIARARYRLGMILLGQKGRALVEKANRLQAELDEQRKKTRQLYLRNKEYAERIRRGAPR